MEQIAKWVEEIWGYLWGFPGMEYHRKAVDAIKENLYVITYSGELIGIFGLFDYESFNKTIKPEELMYVYLDESFRR